MVKNYLLTHAEQLCNQYRITWSRPFWVKFKKHFCPSCGSQLKIQSASEQTLVKINKLEQAVSTACFLFYY
jgi:hypothetical protein